LTPLSEKLKIASPAGANMNQTQEVENYEVSFAEGQGEAIITFDVKDVSEELDDPTALRLFPDKVEVDFGPDQALLFPKLPPEIYKLLSPLKGMWVCGLRESEIEVAGEVEIARQ
jgi:hypothetical protein